MKLYLKDLNPGFIEWGRLWLERLFRTEKELDEEQKLCHHGVEGQKWGVRRGPPYPLGGDEKPDDHSMKSKKRTPKGPIVIPPAKLLKYALDPAKDPDKAKAFRDALGYTRENASDLIVDIQKNMCLDKLVEKGDSEYGRRYEYVMHLKGPNGKSANVLTGWIDDGKELRLTTVHITKKKVTE